jgi:hypothetical protein
VVEGSAQVVGEDQLVGIAPSATARETIALLLTFLSRQRPSPEITQADDSSACCRLGIGEGALPGPLANDSDHAGRLVDVAPLEPEQLALAKASRDREGVERGVAVASHRVEEGVDLLDRPRRPLRPIERRRAELADRVEPSLELDASGSTNRPGPRQRNVTNVWIYIVGPTIGAFAGVIAYRYVGSLRST